MNHLRSYTGPHQILIPLATDVWTLEAATKAMSGQWHCRKKGTPEKPPGAQVFPQRQQNMGHSTSSILSEALGQEVREITQAGEKQCGKEHRKKPSFLHWTWCSISAVLLHLRSGLKRWKSAERDEHLTLNSILSQMYSS